MKNLCFINDVNVSGTGAQAHVTWQLQGAWDRIAGATVSVYLQQDAGHPGRWSDVACLADRVPCDAKSADVDLTGHRGKRLRVIVRRNGDQETGGMSSPFDLD